VHVTEECKINGIRLTEFTYANIAGTPEVSITYALTQVDPNTKATTNTHGKVTAVGGNMSAYSWELLLRLLAHIEKDLAPRHFTIDPKETDDEPRTATSGPEETPQI
jgi:hypothetical protein